AQRHFRLPCVLYDAGNNSSLNTTTRGFGLLIEPKAHCDPHSGLMLDALITWAHFTNSTLTCWANCSGVLATGSKPSAASRSLISGSTMILTIALCMKAMICFGVPAGTTSPCQLSPVTSG